MGAVLSFLEAQAPGRPESLEAPGVWPAWAAGLRSEWALPRVGVSSVRRSPKTPCPEGGTTRADNLRVSFCRMRTKPKAGNTLFSGFLLFEVPRGRRRFQVEGGVAPGVHAAVSWPHGTILPAAARSVSEPSVGLTHFLGSSDPAVRALPACPPPDHSCSAWVTSTRWATNCPDDRGGQGAGRKIKLSICVGRSRESPREVRHRQGHVGSSEQRWLHGRHGRNHTQGWMRVSYSEHVSKGEKWGGNCVARHGETEVQTGRLGSGDVAGITLLQPSVQQASRISYLCQTRSQDNTWAR